MSGSVASLRDRIRISIRSLNQATVFRIDSRHLPLACLDIEGPTAAHLHAPHMDAPRCKRGGDDRPHPVSRFETADVLLAPQITRREAMLRKVRAAMLSATSGPDGELFAGAALDSCQFPDAQGVQGMGLLHSKPGAIPPG